jgi:hypothetical protein
MVLSGFFTEFDNKKQTRDYSPGIVEKQEYHSYLSISGLNLRQ